MAFRKGSKMAKTSVKCCVVKNRWWKSLLPHIPVVDHARHWLGIGSAARESEVKNTHLALAVQAIQHQYVSVR